MQRNWIGRSEGALVDFKLDGPAGPAGDKITVFTTRIDTIYGATSLQLAPEHPMSHRPDRQQSRAAGKVEDLIARAAHGQRSRRHRRHREERFLRRSYALNPFSGEKIPIWVANYILMDYGTGAIMSVPAHDERDYEFAKKYGLDIRLLSIRAAKAMPSMASRTNRSCPSSRATAC